MWTAGPNASRSRPRTPAHCSADLVFTAWNERARVAVPPTWSRRRLDRPELQQYTEHLLYLPGRPRPSGTSSSSTPSGPTRRAWPVAAPASTSAPRRRGHDRHDRPRPPRETTTHGGGRRRSRRPPRRPAPPTTTTTTTTTTTPSEPTDILVSSSTPTPAPTRSPPEPRRSRPGRTRRLERPGRASRGGLGVDGVAVRFDTDVDRARGHGARVAQVVTPRRRPRRHHHHVHLVRELHDDRLFYRIFSTTTLITLTATTAGRKPPEATAALSGAGRGRRSRPWAGRARGSGRGCCACARRGSLAEHVGAHACQVRPPCGPGVGRRLGAVPAPDDHRGGADLALRDPADVVLVEPRRDAGRLAEVAARVLGEAARAVGRHRRTGRRCAVVAHGSRLRGRARSPVPVGQAVRLERRETVEAHRRVGRRVGPRRQELHVVARRQRERQVVVGLVVEHVDAVAGGSGEHDRTGRAAVVRRADPVADRLVGRLDESAELADVEVDPTAVVAFALAGHEHDLAEQDAGVADEVAAGLGDDDGRPAVAEVRGGGLLDRRAVAGDRGDAVAVGGTGSRRRGSTPRG